MRHHSPNTPSTVPTLLCAGFALLLALTLSGYAVAEKDAGEVRPYLDGPIVFVLSYQPDDLPEGLYLYGKHRPGTRVTLLGKHQRRQCGAVTRESRRWDGDIKSFWVTRLRPAFDCGQRDEYAVAVLGVPVRDYETIPLKDISGAERAKLEAQVRASEVLAGMKERVPGVPLDPEDGQLAEDIEAVRYSMPNLSVTVLTYFQAGVPRDDQYPVGPRIVVIDGTPAPLTGWCSYPTLRAFRLNGEYYLESGSGCCDCGKTAAEVFKIERGGPRLVQQDWSETD